MNELWGGTRSGYIRVSDANYDWGQGLPELARWQEQHGEARLAVWYFGTDPIIDRLPIQIVPLHILPIGKPEDVLPLVRGRLLAVSTTLRYGGMGMTPAYEHAKSFLSMRRPVARTTTFLIYDFTHEEGLTDSSVTDEAPLSASAPSPR